MLDLDGTLAPVAPKPHLARLPLETARLLESAAAAEEVRLVVVSARPVREVRRLVRVRRAVLVGQYGLEGPTAPAAAARARFRRGAARLVGLLRPIVRRVPGALLEPKGYTLGVHYRGVPAAAARRLLRTLRAVSEREAADEGFVPVAGRKVVDFVPAGFDKGRAVRAIVSRLRPDTVAYFGDSTGDEPAFQALRPRDWPVRVGLGHTRARYRVAGPPGVARFLGAVARFRAGTAGSKEVEP